jgi:hypothetical protein
MRGPLATGDADLCSSSYADLGRLHKPPAQRAESMDYCDRADLDLLPMTQAR